MSLFSLSNSIALGFSDKTSHAILSLFFFSKLITSLLGFADNVPQHILLYLMFLYSISFNLFSYTILSLNNSEAFGLPDNVGQSIFFYILLIIQLPPDYCIN